MTVDLTDFKCFIACKLKVVSGAYIFFFMNDKYHYGTLKFFVYPKFNN